MRISSVAGVQAVADVGPPRATAAGAVACLTAAWAVYVGRFWWTSPLPVSSFDDGVLYLAAALHLREPALFAGDWGFQAMVPIMEPLLYTRGLSVLWPWWDAPEALLRALSALLIGVFALGVFTLVRTLTRALPVALLAGLIALRPRMAFLTEWGILMGQPLARSVIMAAAPWILAWVWRARHRPLGLALAGLATGLLALFHPLSALQLAMVVVLQELLVRPRALAVVWFGGGVVVGALPALVRHGGLLADRPAPVWFLQFRNPELLPAGIPALAGPLIYDFGVPLVLFALVLRASRTTLTAAASRWLWSGTIAAAVLTLATVLAPLAPMLGRLSLGRASGFLYLFVSVPILTVAWAKWRAGPVSRLAALALVAALALSTGAWWDRVLDRTIAAAGIPLGPRTGWNPARSPEPLPALALHDPQREPAAFRELSEWVRNETPPSALVLAPPGDAARLRLYGRRGVAVATKDAGLFIFSAAKAIAWYDRFRDVAEAYANPETAWLVAVARRYGATHIVTVAGERPVPLPPVFVNQGYVVYKVSGTP